MCGLDEQLDRTAIFALGGRLATLQYMVAIEAVADGRHGRRPAMLTDFTGGVVAAGNRSQELLGSLPGLIGG